MRHTLIIVFVSGLLLLAGCAPITTSVQSMQLTGSGTFVTQDFAFEKADRLLVASNFKAKVTPGEKVAVTVRADDNVMEHVYVHVSNNELRLELQPGRGYSMTRVTLEAEVTMPAPSRLIARDNGVVDVSDLRVSQLDVNLEGNGIVTGNVSAARIDVKGNGNGQLRLTGAAAELKVNASGNAIVTCPEMDVNTADVELRDNGMAALHVTDKLGYNLSGNAGLTYSGDPQLGEQKTSGNANARRK
jgi:hypothetical protein